MTHLIREEKIQIKANNVSRSIGLLDEVGLLLVIKIKLMGNWNEIILILKKRSYN